VADLAGGERAGHRDARGSIASLGEADFWLDRADLAAMRFDKVMGDTRGG